MTELKLTREGYERLERELNHLVNVRRREVAEELRRALGVAGDLEDNSELMHVREEQERLERRIAVLRERLRAAEVADSAPEETGVAALGRRVVLEDLDAGEREEYVLVGPTEASLSERRLSVASPVGQAIVGRRPGETVEVEAPRGRVRFKLVDVVAA